MKVLTFNLAVAMTSGTACCSCAASSCSVSEDCTLQTMNCTGHTADLCLLTSLLLCISTSKLAKQTSSQSLPSCTIHCACRGTTWLKSRTNGNAGENCRRLDGEARPEVQLLAKDVPAPSCAWPQVEPASCVRTSRSSRLIRRSHVWNADGDALDYRERPLITGSFFAQNAKKAYKPCLEQSPPCMSL